MLGDNRCYQSLLICAVLGNPDVVTRMSFHSVMNEKNILSYE